MEVDDLTEDVQRVGLTPEGFPDRDNTPGRCQPGGNLFEIVNNSQNAVVVNGNTAAPAR